VTLVNIGVDGTNTLTSCDFGPTLTGILFDTGSSGTLREVALRNHNVSNGSGGYCNSGTPVLSKSGSSVTITDSSVRNFDGQPNNTVSNNTITDAVVGVYGVTGNTVTGNTYRTVTTLTQ